MSEKSRYGEYSDTLGRAFSRIIVNYAAENCTDLAGSATDTVTFERTLKHTGYDYLLRYYEGGCSMGGSVFCTLHESVSGKCRLNIRMNAAFVLFASLTIKAIYMITVNILARGKRKRHCLTFGDVLVASATNPELRISGECMVNGGDNVRGITSHTCHKHCKSKEESKTGGTSYLYTYHPSKH